MDRFPTTRPVLSSMTAQNPLDHSGTFVEYPFAELLVEIGEAKLDGSLRLSSGEKRSILYFKEGSLVYGVSKSPEHRLQYALAAAKKLTQGDFRQLTKCTNDLELRASIVAAGLMSKDEVDEAIAKLVEKIVIDVLTWPDGTWHFSPLVRSREDLIFPVKIEGALLEYARCLPSSVILPRFKSLGEKFQRKFDESNGIVLQKHEDFVLQRFDDQPRKIQELILECGLPENGFLQALYVLWLGGILRRLDWNSAFSTNRLAAIQNARVAVVRKAQTLAAEAPRSTAKTDPTSEADALATPDPQPVVPETIEISLTDYLTRVEEAKTHYDVLGLNPKAAVAEIKASYFSLAKLFHPDRYHREDAVTQQRVQTAFSSVQVAYDTLKAGDSRENYDYKVRKELEIKEKVKAQSAATGGTIDQKAEQGLESFEIGLNLLMEEDYEHAVPFLGRAAHYSPDNALYRAYFGKALSYDEKQRHKAEGEMQMAVKLDPRNPKIRMMLAEFLIENNLLKRAEGELRRFLELVPDNQEARRLLEKLQG